MHDKGHYYIVEGDPVAAEVDHATNSVLREVLVEHQSIGEALRRCWVRGITDVADGAKEAELAFLKTEIYRGGIDLLTRRIEASDRFSDRR